MGHTRLRRLSRFVLFALLSTLAPVLAGAQTVLTNPTTVQFVPSADHNAVTSDGTPVVDHYSLDVYSVGAAQPFQSSNIGKPAPAADGFIYYDFSSSVASWPLPGGNYEARVDAVGSGGSGLSDPSNPFTFDSCTYALSGSSASLPASGGGTQIGVTAGASCGWTASSPVSWVALSPLSGTGAATVVGTVAANTSSSSRSATLTVAGQAFTVNQQGAAASASSPSAPSNPSPASGAGNVGIAPTLTWSAGGATSYEVRFGTANPPARAATGLTTASYAPGTLAAGTTYYWQVVAANGSGSTAGPVWSFTTTRHPRKK